MYKLYEKYIILSLFFILICSCSSVRSNYFDPKAQNEQDKQKIGELNKTDNKGNNTDERFKDTTVIMIGQAGDTNLVKPGILDQAISEFDSEKYEECCPKFRNISETISNGDSVYYESLFYLSECELIDKKIEEGRSNLELLVKDKKVPDTILQKSLVRLGQVYCVLNDKPKAQELFNRLKSEFPDSIYLKLANCAAVGVK
jgi:hypothetical protein